MFEARHFDAAQKPRQGKDETLEERRASPPRHPSEWPAWIGIWLLSYEVEPEPSQPEVSLLQKFPDAGFSAAPAVDSTTLVRPFAYPLRLELFFYISKRRCGGHAGFIQLNLIVILQQAQQLHPPQRIQLQVCIQPQ